MEEDRLRKRKSEEISLAPKRPPKTPNLSSDKDKVFERPLFSNEEPKKEIKIEDSFNISDLSSSEEDKKCFICCKPISHLTEDRRRLHINSCLDIQETIRKQDRATEKHQNTTDCPVCLKPFPPGPHRTAHIKSCGKKNAISGSKLLEMVEIQEKVTAVRKNNKLNHTKAPPPKVKPVTAPKLSGQPKSVNDEQIMLAKAMSNSIRPYTPPVPNSIEALKESTPQFTRVPDSVDKRKKRPKSFAVVEFAPRTCQCQVVSAVQTRFVNAFKSAVRAPKTEDFVSPRMDSQAKYQLRLVEKTNRYDRLADDFSALFNNGTEADIHITCGDGVIPVHRIILKARTRGLVKNEPTIRMEEPKEIVTSWLRFIYTARVEWSPGQEDAIQALAQKYGPDSLLYVYRKKKIEEVPAEKSIPTISEELNECMLGPSTSTVSQVTAEVPSNLAQDTNGKEIFEDTICGVLDGTNANDGEDPMQGINLSATTNEAITEEKEAVDESDECIVLDETAENEQNRANITSVVMSLPTVPLVTPLSRGKVLPDSPDIFDSNSSDGQEEVIAQKKKREPWHMTPISINPNATISTYEETEAEKTVNITVEQNIEEGDQNKVFDYPVFDEPTAEKTVVVAVEQKFQKEEEVIAEKTINITEEQNVEEQQYQDEYFGYPMDEVNDYYQWNEAPSFHPIESPPHQPSTSRSLQNSPTASFLQRTSEKFETPKCSISKRRPSRLSANQVPEGDSFDKSVDLIPRSSLVAPSRRFLDVPPLAHSTPIQQNKKLRFGSNVKILKTTGITPMPDYNKMDDDNLKKELATHGLRPLGRKRAVAKLIEIYESVHPQIDPSTPTLRPLDPALPGVKEVEEGEDDLAQKGHTRKVAQRKLDPTSKSHTTPTKNAAAPISSAESSPGSDNDDLGDKTLNSERDEPAEESMIDDPTSLPKNMEEMKAVFLKWLRKKENDGLYNHILRLQPVLLDELHLKTSKADDPVCSIPKKSMGNVLESLGITFSLPVTTRGGPRVAIRPGGGRGGGGARRGRK